MKRLFAVILLAMLFAILFTSSAVAQSNPEPSGWYAGDMHVHRSCGGSPESVSSMFSHMTPQKLAVTSLLADMGNGEVQNSITDLPLVNGQDDSISTASQILHWDTEWHWDATYNQYAHQALGGHLVALGLSDAHQMWQEYTYPVLDWAHQQHGVAGFAHMQFLTQGGLPQTLTCCTPIEYPVEVALGGADFISEDVDDVNSAFSMQPEEFIQAYYRLLNSGFRPGFAAGTDYPCNGSRDTGSLLTYVQVSGGQLSYRNWVDGIAKGRTVISRNGHNEFLNLVVNTIATPGDEIQMANAGNVTVTVQWTSTQNLSGTIDLVQNGTVVASKSTSAGPGSPATLTATVNFAKSGWLAARRTDGNQHYVHTAAVFVTINNAPVRASAADTQYFIDWTNGLLQNTSVGGIWNSYFPTSLTAAQARYQAARDLYQQIASEASGSAPTLTSITLLPGNSTVATGTAQPFTATGHYSDGTTLNLTGETKWASSNTLVATITPRGVAAAINSGTTTISASLGGVSGSTTLTVGMNPLVISTQTLSGGIVNVSYSATLAASGGTQPYSWSLSSGSLPPGLSLNNSTGTISGTPTTAGTFNFSAQASDLSIPQQVATKSLSIVISSSGGGSCPCSIWPSTTVPQLSDSGPDSPVELGVKFRADTDGYITGIRFYKGVGNTGTHVGNLWSSSGVRLATVTFTGETTTGWQQGNFSSPVAITANTVYVASYFAPTGHYADDLSYFAAAGVDRAPLHALADGSSGSDGVYGYGSSSSFPSLGWQSSNYWVDVVFVNSTAPDTTPPTIVSTVPAAGATGINLGTSVTARFSEPIDSTTVNSNTFQLRDSSNTLITASVSYNTSTQTATLQPSISLAALATYTAAVQGGSAGVKDLAGNALVSNVTWSFTTTVSSPPPGGASSIWASSTTPTEVDGGDGAAVEVGVKFRSDMNGSITGIRYYKSTANTGTHIGNLWASNGTLLATATFSQESSTGWQQVTFNPPVAVSANTTYVASYFAPNGHYSATVGYFATAGVDNAPLHALRDGLDGGNGLYHYGSSSSFPTLTWQSSNYWVDVVFTATGTTTAPTVVAVSPVNAAGGINLGTTVSATFSEPMDSSTLTATTFLLADSTGQQIPGTVAYTSANATATLTPSTELTPSMTYSVTVKGGSTGVKDYNGNAMASDFSWSFTTGATPPSSGPGGPILVITSASNPFTSYYGEILSAEGFNEYSLADIGSVSATILSNYDVAILGDMSLTSTQVTMLSDWVNGGGRLIAMHPDKQLATLLGLTPTGSTLSNAYLLVQNSSGPGVGIVGQTIQFHGPADLYTLNGATRLATLYSNASTATTSPAATLTNVGAGQAAAFTYDLARSIVYTRQGNPAWSGEKRDGQVPPTRSDDLYFGNASFDPQPDWVDLSKVAIPQADEQQRLLANLILQMVAARKPLPRFWYLPSGFKAAIVMTGDDHGNDGTSGRFDIFLGDSPTGCSLADWQCVRSTSYIYPGTPISSSQVAAYTAQGFEVALHVTTECSDWTPSSLESFYVDQLAEFASTYPTAAAPRTNRTHCIAWSDYDTQPKVELNHGIRLDANYYYWPATWVNDQPGMFTGSGMPMRFTDRNGNLIDVYQATTQMTDESGQSYPFNIDTLLDNAVGSQGYYGVFTANMHNDSAQSDEADAIVASAQAHGVPVVSALQMLTWLDGRNSSSFGSLVWSGNTLSFTITQDSGARNLQAMLPTNGASGTLSSISRSGNSVAFTTQTIKGISYAMFAAATGSYQAVYGGGPPAIVLASVSVNPTSVVGGAGASGTVTLSGPAPTTGATVTLSSSNTAVAQVPPSVVVSSGNTTVTFAVSTSAVSTSTNVTITGALGGTRTAMLTVTPASVNVSSLTLTPTSVQGGIGSTGTVRISGPAPSGGAMVTLVSDNSAAVVPASVTVGTGATSANFNVVTNPVASSTTANISATYDTTVSAPLTITPPSLTSVTLNPTTVNGGSSSNGTVTLSGAAPTGGLAVVLSSSNTNVAQTPTSVTVAAGNVTATFTVTTSAVATNSTATITATLGSVHAGATLTVNAVTSTLSALSLNPSSVTGGTNSTGTVTLTGPAPTGGTSVALQSSNTAAATVPASVSVPAGSTTATFTATTYAVANNSSTTITATLGTSKTAALTVNAATLSSISRSPSSVVGGANSTGTVTLNGPAPLSGVIVMLQSSNTSVAHVPASVSIAAGARSASFTISTTPVSANTSVTITGTYRVARTTILTVTAAALSSISRSPSTVVGGNTSTGTVTLNGAASANGAVVTLQSSNNTAAQVPASVSIAPGATSATFTITTIGVASSTSVTLTGVYGNTRTTTLTVSVASLTSLTLNPSTVTGGSSSTGTLTLNGAAPPAGAVVSLSSTNTSAAQVPATATIPGGARNVTFTATTSPVHGTTSTIRGTYRSTTQSTTLTVQ